MIYESVISTEITMQIACLQTERSHPETIKIILSASLHIETSQNYAVDRR